MNRVHDNVIDSQRKYCNGNDDNDRCVDNGTHLITRTNITDIIVMTMPIVQLMIVATIMM